MRSLLALIVCSYLCSAISGATLEKLSIEQMTQKSTQIVRGKVTGCDCESRGALIYTRCRMAVSERWKGMPSAQVDFVIPGGTANGLTQTFSGTPKLNKGEEYVLFLWAGRSGLNQIIGLSQGALAISVGPKGSSTAQRAAISELMLDASGQPVRDSGIDMSISALRERVILALGGQVR
jgi:hypothetical protein